MEITVLVNDLAVLGTTLFMLAASSIWYSNLLFGPRWEKETGCISDTDQGRVAQGKQIIRMFLSYGVVVYGIAWMMPYVLKAGLVWWQVSLGIFICAASWLAGLALSEKRSVAYYLITIGFLLLFLMGSSYMIINWPW